MKRTIIAISALLISGLAWAEGDRASQGILDFAVPPAQLGAARLVEVDGEPVNAPISKTSFWLDAGEHEIVVAASFATSASTINPKTASRHQSDGGQGRTTILVEAGKRYKIAAMMNDDEGHWEPVIWKEVDIE